MFVQFGTCLCCPDQLLVDLNFVCQLEREFGRLVVERCLFVELWTAPLDFVDRQREREFGRLVVLLVVMLKLLVNLVVVRRTVLVERLKAHVAVVEPFE